MQGSTLSAGCQPAGIHFLSRARCTLPPYPRGVTAVADERLLLFLYAALEPVLNQHGLVVFPSAIEADYNGVRERDGERAPCYHLFYQLTRMVRARGARAQDDRIDALAGGVAFWTRHLARDTDKVVLDHNDAMFNKELEKFMRQVLDNKDPPKRRWASIQARNAHRRIH